MTAALTALLLGEIAPGLFAWRGDSSRDIGGEASRSGWIVRDLDTTTVQDAAQLYDQIATAWDLPEWFGRNLDALWDVLGDLAVAPVLIVWTGCDDLTQVDPELAQTILELFRDASTQASALAVVVLQAPELTDLDGLL